MDMSKDEILDTMFSESGYDKFWEELNNPKAPDLSQFYWTEYMPEEKDSVTITLKPENLNR